VRRHWAHSCALLIVLVLAAPEFAAAQAGSTETSEGDDAQAPYGDESQRLEEAKRFFREGNALRKNGAFLRALEAYQRSRALVPSVSNTLNAAYCLEQLSRFDEALELYEDLLARFERDLDETSRAAVAAAARKLRAKVASVDVSANVAGLVVIDGRMRGKLPLPGPVRVMPGKHVLRIIHDGYVTHEVEVEVRVGDTTRVDARLEPLASSGRLRVEAPSLTGAALFVDGAAVGVTPWEGTLAPGQHVFWVLGENRGTAPAVAVVVQGQTALVSARPQPLSRPMRIVTEPRTARLSLGTVPIGVGVWEGALPAGRYTFEASEEGYRPASLTQSLEVGQSPGLVTLALRVDPEHPRWAKPATARVYLDAFGGYALGGTLGSDAEASCDSGNCYRNSQAAGVMAGLRGGYEFPIGLALELSAGYLGLSKEISRSVTATYDTPPIPATYTFDDALQIRGVMASTGANYRLELSKSLFVDLRLHVGALFGRAQDRVTGTASARGETTDAYVQRSGEQSRFAAPMVLPSLRMVASVGAFHAGIGVMIPIFPVEGPRNAHGDTEVRGCDPVGNPQGVSCAQGQSFLREERLYGRFTLVVPTISAGVDL
jgi:tetratricopeptide (TPR) repeat protein